jgi:transposase
VKVLHERVAGIDVHKKMIKVAIRSPGDKPWTRKTEILTFRTFYGVLRAMARELRRRGVTHVVMEASGVCTDPVYYALCEEEARASEIQRLGKALESAGIKLGSVASDITGKGPTAMIEALIDGERRGAVMADLATGHMRAAGKLADLSMALEGRFTGHHALMCRLILDRVKVLDAAVADLEAQIAVRAAPWQREISLLTTIPGFGETVAQAWIAEIGPAPHQWFGSHEKLASWASLAPGNYISAGKRKHGRTGDAGTYIKPMLVQAAWSAIRVKGRLQARFNRLVRRMGGPKNPAAKKKAIVAIAHTLLKIAYTILRTGIPYQDPGADFYTRRETPGHRQAWLESQIRKLHPGRTITITVSPPPDPVPETALTPGA